MEDDILVTETSPLGEGKRRRGPLVVATLLLAIALFAISLIASSSDDAVVAAGDASASNESPLALAQAPGEELVGEDEEAASDVEDELDERNEEIAALEQQVAFLQQAFNGLQSEVDANEAGARLNELAAANALEGTDSISQWRIGYSIGGGQNLASFENVILPCESGSQPDPDTAVGRTDDWGRAQINRPTWKNRFEELTGANFEENIVDPILNGFMAAHVEQEQGLTAWTCWRNR